MKTAPVNILFFLWCLQVKEQQIWWNDIFENRIEMDSKYYVHADTDKSDDEQPAPVILRQWV